MAGLEAVAQTAEVATGTSLKTLLQLIAPANQRLVVKEWSISFDGIANTDAPIQVNIVRQTTAGTMSALTPEKLNESDQETLQATAQHTATIEPTTGATVMSEQVHPQAGYTHQPRLGSEIIIEGGNRLGLSVLAGADVNAKARFIFAE